MEVKEFVVKSFPVISHYSGVNAIEHVLLENEYAVVVDENNKFKGILTPADLVKRPHKIVIDCLTEKGYISDDEDISNVIDKFNNSNCPILPVFREKDFIGVIEKKNVIDGLKTKASELYNRSLISEKLKHSFLMNLSHEVRTPLNGILGFMDILMELKEEDHTIDKDECRNIIKNSTDRFLLIMNDLVDLSLFHSGCTPDIRMEEIKIENIFSDLKSYFETTSIVLNKDITIKYSNPDISKSIFSDGKKIKHILYHLIDNAIKFSFRSCVISYGYKVEKGTILFYVENSGLTIPEDKKEKIFNAFEKQENTNNDLIEGTGIGLTLVKGFTELLDGKVSFISENKQTTFYCEVPLKEETVDAY